MIMKKKKIPKQSVSWLVTIQEDSKTGEQFIELPKGLLENNGWKEGDDILWDELPDGGFKLVKIEKK